MRKGAVMHTEKGTGAAEGAGPGEQRVTENRWCEQHGYFIDVDACRARALQRLYCGRCLVRWRQLPLPFPEPV
jgi:hypothetical protein